MAYCEKSWVFIFSQDEGWWYDFNIFDAFYMYIIISRYQIPISIIVVNPDTRHYFFIALLFADRTRKTTEVHIIIIINVATSAVINIFCGREKSMIFGWNGSSIRCISLSEPSARLANHLHCAWTTNLK